MAPIESILGLAYVVDGVRSGPYIIAGVSESGAVGTSERNDSSWLSKVFYVNRFFRRKTFSLNGFVDIGEGV